MEIALPKGAAELIALLEAGGFEAWAVGGCVRDSLLGRPVHDWDVCTNALPDEVRRCCAGLPVLSTGEKHGTVSVGLGGAFYEVTTYRHDGVYRDHRRPESVTFVRGLAADLARRDFTVNAMAYNPRAGLVDLFGGREDLAQRRIRCVGAPAERFGEDALRVLRALRFASVLQFALEARTAAAAAAQAPLLREVSAERAYAELTRLLCGAGAGEVLSRFGAVLAPVLPEIVPCMGFDQHNPYHDRDVWQHTACAVGAAVPQADVRWAMLLHDLGKPDTFKRGADGTGHFIGHEARSEAIARAVLTRLKAESARTQAVCLLVALHGVPLEPTEKSVRRWLARLGPKRLDQLVAVHRADGAALAAAHPAMPGRRAQLDAFEALVQRQLAQDACFTLRALAVKGGDVIAAGVPAGPDVGRVLRALLRAVVDGELPNSREALLAALPAAAQKELQKY